MVNVELVLSVIAVIVALGTVFQFGMRIGRLEKDVERMEAMMRILKELWQTNQNK